MFAVTIPNRLRLIYIAFFALLHFTWTFAPFSGQADTFVVRSTNDSGPGTLRQAVNDNNALGGGNTITFSNVVVGTITLAAGELPISTDVIIIGPSSQLLTLSGNNSNRVFNINSTNAHVDVSGLTLANATYTGGGGGFGGAVYNEGILNISACTLSNNSSQYGAAVANGGFLTISNTLVCSNRTISGSGGGLYNNGRATIVNSTFYGNKAYQGGALDNGDTMLVTNCTLFANEAAGGGGIYNGGTLAVRNATIVSNNATALFDNNGGGIYTSGTADIGSTIIADNLTATNTGPDVYGGVASAGYNLISRTNGSAGFTMLGDQFGTINSPLAPLLGPLQFNGGPTPTLAPLSGSPTIDRGKTSATTDQRSRARPADFPSLPNATNGDGSDIGAVEIWPNSPLLTISSAGANVILSWSASDFRLQSLTNLVSSNWVNVTGTVVPANGQYYLTNPITGPEKFYRLTFP